MFESFGDFFSSALFMPHGHCYLWQPAMVWLQVLSNGIIALAYVAISATLALLVHRLRDDIPFRGMYLAFGAFIVLCGITHVFDVYVIWSPVYWLDGTIRAATAIVSAGTAILLPTLLPHARTLARGARTVRERGIALETAVRDLETMYQKTRELDELRSQFFANVSHELRTPLTLILGPVQRLLAGSELTAGQRRDLELVLRNARLLHRHVDDLLDAARVDAGKLRPDHVAADLAQVVSLIAANFEGLAADRGIEYAVDAAGPLPAEIDVDKVERVVLNLLSNAFKFTPSGGRIRCTLTAAPAAGGGGGTAILTVADSGPGIRPEQRELIFERFRQLDGGATRRVGGTGLGLSIAREFVAVHGGRIAVGDAPEGGALFTVELPLRAPAGVEVGAARVEPGDGDGAALARQAIEGLRARVDSLAPARATGPVVLVVEDNPEMNRFVCEVLAAEARAVPAFDGDEGLRRALELRPDLVVTDLMMPGISGDELVRRLRASGELAHMPILLLTAKSDDELRIRLLRDGAQDYVVKPFSAEELRARASNLVTLKRAQDVLIEAHSAAESARSELETFSYSVAHDLRGPLRGLDGFSQLLLEDYGDRIDASGHGYLQRIRAAARRMSDLIDGLIELARIGRSPLVSQRVDLTRAARLVADELAAAEPERRVEITIEGALIAHGDPRLVQQALQNLIGNAWKFTRDAAPAHIAVGVAERGGRAAFYVRDNGVGFDMDHANRLFSPFQRLHEADGFPGTGIGLATVQRIVARHGGRIWAESARGAGTTFWFTLPASARDQAAVDEAAAPAAP